MKDEPFENLTALEDLNAYNEPMTDLYAYDPFAVRSSGKYPEGFPLSLTFEGTMIDDNMALPDPAAGRPIRDAFEDLRRGMAIRRGEFLGQFGRGPQGFEGPGEEDDDIFGQYGEPRLELMPTTREFAPFEREKDVITPISDEEDIDTGLDYVRSVGPQNGLDVGVDDDIDTGPPVPPVEEEKTPWGLIIGLGIAALILSK